MQSLGYWDAWWHWWRGLRLDSFSMMGIPFVWWGRIGKVLQFSAGLLVILDLVGQDRLRVTTRKMKSKAQNATLSAWSARLKPPPTMPLGEALRSMRGSLVILLISFLGPFVALLSWAYLLVIEDTDGIASRFLWLLAIAISAFVSAALWAFTLRLLLNSLLWPLLGLAWLLKAGHPGHPLRWIAFVVATIGFHLDLLAT